MSEEKFREWCILELMGHRRLAGLVTEVEIGGASFLRLDVPEKEDEGMVATQFYSPAAVYCITPMTEEIAREVAKENGPEPVHRWELGALVAPGPERRLDEPDVGGGEYPEFGYSDDDYNDHS